ncbi:MAG: hypothetical protein KIS80_09200, partial [Anaerolineales bacterium]|nr:hypothetical protein [Anaerolineales bacterium]
MSQNTYVPGLEGVVAAQTRMSKVDGLAGELVIGGFKLETIADKASYEEMVYQLWYGQLPKETELQAFTAELAALRSLPPAALDLLRSIAHKDLDIMDALRVATGVLDTESDAQDSDEWLAKRLLAATPTIVAAAWRLRNGQEPLSPDPKLAHAANYLYMLEGQAPSAARARGLETYLNTVIDHGLNASTFTARVITSTGSDFVS